MLLKSAEQQRWAMSGNEHDEIDQVAGQLQAVVLREWKDIEEINSRVQDEKRRGSVIYGEILERQQTTQGGSAEEGRQQEKPDQQCGAK